MRKGLSIITVVLLVLTVAAQAVIAAPLVPVAAGGKAAAAQSGWEISEITFAGVEEDGTPVGTDVVFVEGTPTIYAIFDFTGLVADDVLTAVWYQDDEEALTQEFTVSDIYNSRRIPDEGTIWFFADFSEASAATYDVELYVNDDFAVDGRFVVVPPEEATGPSAMGASGNVVSLSQQIPIIITIPHPDDPDQTISVPVTLTVDLHISMDSGPEVIIEVGEATGFDSGTGDLTEEQLAYVVAVADYMLAYGDSITALGDLFTEAGQDAWLLEDQGWLDAVYAELDILIALSDEVRALEAPEGLEDVQEELNTAADYFENAAFLYDDALSAGDEGLLGDATEELVLGGEALQRAADLLDAWGTP